MRSQRLTFQPEFPLLDLVAREQFRSTGSVSFRVGSCLAEIIGNPVEPGVYFATIGWVEIHYPCDGHIKAQVRAKLPQEYHTADRRQQFIDELFAAVGIPSDETFEAELLAVSESSLFDRHVDRHGDTNRLV